MLQKLFRNLEDVFLLVVDPSFFNLIMHVNISLNSIIPFAHSSFMYKYPNSLFSIDSVLREIHIFARV